ncbi:MAG TPA: PilZ domain-containing protein [Candidatus Methylomirabilis sp.]|nr:PilZ domain-containing protein [Candidatus Methylomirabilis sp.]
MSPEPPGIEVPEPLEPQVCLQLRLQTNEGGIEVVGRVMWGEEPPAGEGGIFHGVAFTHLAPKQREALLDVLRSLTQGRRAGIRLPLDIQVTCWPEGESHDAISGRTGDISRGGLLLRLPRVLAPGTVLEVSLDAPGGPLQVRGMIVWAEPAGGPTTNKPIRHGFRFTAVDWPTSLVLGRLAVERG